MVCRVCINMCIEHVYLCMHAIKNLTFTSNTCTLNISCSNQTCNNKLFLPSNVFFKLYVQNCMLLENWRETANLFLLLFTVLIELRSNMNTEA